MDDRFPVTYGTKWPGATTCLAMVFKLAQKAQNRWRKLNGSEKLQDLIDGIVFVDGLRKAAWVVAAIHSFWK